MDNAAPQFLNVLRVCDVPESLGLLAPRPLRIVTEDSGKFARTTDAYKAADSMDQLSIGAR
jgi:hypothetical protein